MTTNVQARDLLVTHFHTDWSASHPTVPVFYENTTQVALDTVGDVFLTFGVDFVDAIRQDIDPSPITRCYGEIVVRVFSKSGVGSRSSLQLIDYLTDLLKYKNLTGVTTGTPVQGKKRSKDGWSSVDLIVQFEFFQ